MKKRTKMLIKKKKKVIAVIIVYKQLTILYKYYSSRHKQRIIIRNCFGLKRSGFVRTEDNTCHIVNMAKSDAIKRNF